MILQGGRKSNDPSPPKESYIFFETAEPLGLLNAAGEQGGCRAGCHNWLDQISSFLIFRTATSGRFYQVPLRLSIYQMRLNQRPLHEVNFLLFVVLA